MADSPVRSVLAHTIVYQEKEYPLSIASISSDGKVSITPFNGEVHSTVFVSGRVILTPERDPATGLYSWKINSSQP